MVGSAKKISKVREKSRSPSFTREEVFLLLNLVEKYKLFVLNKSTNAESNQAKDVAWLKIARQFNNASEGYVRNADTLKGKWDNLKRNIKKTSINLIDTGICEIDDLNTRVIALISAADSIGCIDIPQELLEEQINENTMNDDNDGSNVESDAGPDVQSEKSSRYRSQNFTPQESKILLQCVRKEKEPVFMKETTSKAIELKNAAWSRIADSYNRLSPQKRSAKCLRVKFTSMKKLARKVSSKDLLKNINIKHGKREKLINDSFQNIKKEPLYEEKIDDDSDQYSNEDPQEDNCEAPPDPLSSVLNGDSGIASSSSQASGWNLNQSDYKEIFRLKTELLNYQMETAKLERKRVEEAMAEDAREREARAAERALRMRAARLAAAEAGARLPPHHAAHLAPPEEARAMQYL